MAASSSSSSRIQRALDLVERAGNRLPDPASLFLLASLTVLLLSGIGATLGWSAEHPRTGEVVAVRSLLSAEGARWVWLHVVGSFTGFAPLGVVLVAMLGIGVAERAGLVGAALAFAVERAPRRLLAPGVVFAGVMSSLAADAGFVVLPPLAAAAFARAGRSPVAGLAAAFVGVAGGFSANLFVTALDPMLSGAAQQAALLLDSSADVKVTASYYFMVASTFFVTAVGGLVTEFVVEPGLERGEDSASTETGEGEVAQPRALAAAALAFVLVSGALSAMVLWPGAPLHGDVELAPGISAPAWTRAIIPLLLVGFLVPAVVFGVVAKTIRSDRDVAKMMEASMASMGGYVVLAFFCGQLVAWFGHSGLGTVLALRGIELLASAALPAWGLLVAIVALSAVMNLFIGSASAKWFLLAPVFVPLFMGLGISPELTLTAYRVGDSATNAIAPLNPYLVVAIVYLKRYRPDAGLGTIVSLMLPYSVALTVGWTALLLLWMAMGWPLGPDNGPLLIPVLQ